VASIKGHGIAYVNLSNTCNFPLPAGSAAGDNITLFIGHSWDTTAPLAGAKWFRASHLTGSNYNGSTFSAVLDATDISNGAITISFAGSGYGHVAGVVFSGTRTYRDKGDSRNGTGAASRTVTSGALPQVGDGMLFFASSYLGTAASSSDLSSTLELSNQANSTAIFRVGSVTVAGAQSATVGYSGSPAGDYQVLYIFY